VFRSIKKLIRRCLSYKSRRSKSRDDASLEGLDAQLATLQTSAEELLTTLDQNSPTPIPHLDFSADALLPAVVTHTAESNLIAQQQAMYRKNLNTSINTILNQRLELERTKLYNEHLDKVTAILEDLSL
jgi:hypothetical protein